MGKLIAGWSGVVIGVFITFLGNALYSVGGYGVMAPYYLGLFWLGVILLMVTVYRAITSRGTSTEDAVQQ